MKGYFVALVIFSSLTLSESQVLSEEDIFAEDSSANTRKSNSVVFTRAQRLKLHDNYPNELGLALGVPSSYGLSYCRWILDNFALKGTFIMWSVSDTGGLKTGNLNIGISGLYAIKNISSVRLVCHVGVHHRNTYDDNPYLGDFYDRAVSLQRNSLTFGPGLISSGTYSTFHFLLGFASSWYKGYTHSNIISPMIEIGSYFHF